MASLQPLRNTEHIDARFDWFVLQYRHAAHVLSRPLALDTVAKFRALVDVS